jgi:hypothetical protein
MMVAVVLNQWKYNIHESNRRAVLILWSEIERILVAEMKTHFVEKDVEQISDFKVSLLFWLLSSGSIC